MEQYGAPRSYLDMNEGVDVISADGEAVGTLTHVLADERMDIFDGIVIEARGGHRFVDAPEVKELRERAVLLTITAAEVERLPAPTENPGVIEHGGAEDSDGPLAQKLRRAWDMITGRY
jgi:hypothetical protein